MVWLGAEAGGERARTAATVVDFWDPAPRSVVRAEAPSCDFWQPIRAAPKPSAPTGVQDFWWPLASKAVEPCSRGIDPVGFDLPRFDPDLAQPLTRPQFRPPSVEDRAQRRARWLVGILDIPEPKRRRRLAGEFAELFYDYPTPQTFRALMDLAVENADPETLLNAGRFRRIFDASGEWRWRRDGSAGPRIAATVLGWTRAYRLAMLCGGDCPADHIDESWFDEWLALPRDDPSSFSYLDWVEARLAGKAHGYWTASPSMFDRMRSLAIPNPTSSTGRLMFAIPDVLGALYPPPPTLNVFSWRSNGTASSRDRVLGSPPG